MTDEHDPEEVAEMLRTFARCVEMGDEIIEVGNAPQLRVGERRLDITVDLT